MEASDVKFDVSFLLGGQIKGERPRLFMLYSAGNFIECTQDTPYLQIGEHKYGKPVLDRAITYDIDLYDALKVGLVQCVAMIPGTSRSGATIIGGMLLGLSRRAATDFSFYLAIPTLMGAGAYSLYKERALLGTADLPMFAVGLVFSFVSAWICVRWLLRYIASHSFTPFAWYRIGFGLLVLVTARTGWVNWSGA